jgi:hypothetical protein
MPAHDGAPAMAWLTGEVAVVKDGIGGDLVGFFEGNTSLRAAVSTNNGASWSWIDPLTKISLQPPSTIAQDATGKVHVLYKNWTGVNYARLSLTRDTSQHITGFGADVADVVLPANVNSNMNIRCQLAVGKDQANLPTLLYAVYDDPATSVLGRITAGKTSPSKGILPAVGSDFVALSGAAGATVVFTGSGNQLETSHENSVHMAQHPASLDIWFEWGPIDTGDSITQNTNPVTRLRAATSGPNSWTLGTASVVERFNGTAPEIASIDATSNYVWFMRFSPTAGLVIDKADATGNITSNAVPGPFGTPHCGGYVSLMVDPVTESRVLVGGWISYDSAATGTFWAKYWNGVAWQAFTDTYPSDTWGVGHSAGWSSGLVFVELDPTTYSPSFATLSIQ